MDDKIIYSRCFNFVECFDSTSFSTIIILIETLESLSNLRSLQRFYEGVLVDTPHVLEHMV